MVCGWWGALVRPIQRGFAGLLAVVLSLYAAEARAEFTLRSDRNYLSPQHFAFELKFGLYSPDIDSSPGLNGAKPFSDLFIAQDSPDLGKRPPGRVLTTLEFDWQIVRGFGSLGLAASVGFIRRTTHSFEYVDNRYTPCKPSADFGCTRSGDETAFNVMPFALELVYRFDVLAQRFHIPLVPYLKGGIAYYLWFIQNGGGGLSSCDKRNPPIASCLDASAPFYGEREQAIGGTFGLVAHPGIALQLDILEPGVARTLDLEMGINHSYLFFELHYAWITGFGAGRKMVLSDTTWNAGLAFEF